MTTRRSILQTLAITPALALAPKVAFGGAPLLKGQVDRVQPIPGERPNSAF